MYAVFLTEHARKFIRKLEHKEMEMILKRIHSICQDPFPHLKRLQGNRLWRLRIADFRAVIDVVVSDRKLVVIRIGHRKNVYDTNTQNL